MGTDRGKSVIYLIAEYHRCRLQITPLGKLCTDASAQSTLQNNFGTGFVEWPSELPRQAHAAPAHTALSVREFLATKQITVLEHPAYSPDLAPNDFFLFLKIKEILKGRHFDDIDDVRSNTTAALEAIPQNQFQNCFEGWTRHWHQCVASQGEYFEGDHGGIQQ